MYGKRRINKWEFMKKLQARGLIAQVTDEPEIRELINNGGARFYIGFDPTADSLHVGHFMALCLMKRLQLAGNRPIVLIGGGTGMVGDPSGRTDMRTMMTPETIQHNCDCFKKQMERFIEFGEDKAVMVNNADWLMDLNYVQLLREVGVHFSVNNMLRAECYKQRMEKGLSFLEFNYMIMQAYDFLHLHTTLGCNMQFGGNDQWSNMLAGTELIRKKTGDDAYAMTITLLLNSEGKKMGKTASGAVWLDPNKTTPFEFFQYWRNIDDQDVNRSASGCSPSVRWRKSKRLSIGTPAASTKRRNCWPTNSLRWFTARKRPTRLWKLPRLSLPPVLTAPMYRPLLWKLLISAQRASFR